jgi:hypothetical protein
VGGRDREEVRLMAAITARPSRKEVVMGAYSIGTDVPPSVDEVLELYRRAGVVDACAERPLGSRAPRPGGGWERLFAADDEAFLLVGARESGRLAASVSAFRDGARTFVLQHAVSSGGAGALLACLAELEARVRDLPGEVGFLMLAYRPREGWPAALARAAVERHPAHLVGQRERECLIRRRWPTGRRPSADPVRFVEAVHLARAALGLGWARCLGIDAAGLAQWGAEGPFARAGLVRRRWILGAREDGALAGFAICTKSSAALNLDRLCSRAELVLDPELARRERVVTRLAQLAARALDGPERPAVLLVEPRDAEAAAAAGWERTGARHLAVYLERDGAAGWASAVVDPEPQLAEAVSARAA